MGGGILEVMARRTSVRNYRREPAAQADLERVVAAGREAEALGGTPVAVHLLDAAALARGGTLLGDLWRVMGAPHYLVLAAREGEGWLTDAGYRFQHAILEATRLGLGTCWIGGMFREAPLLERLGLERGWRVVALSPLGLPAAPGLLGRAVRRVAGSSTRKPPAEIFFRDRHGEPLRPTDVTPALAGVLEAARRAPSWANRQPWRFLLEHREAKAYTLDRQMREGKDYHLLDCGIAMCHFALAAREAGFPGRWTLAPFPVPGAPDAQAVGRYLTERPFLPPS
jgi:nitroreductase